MRTLVLSQEGKAPEPHGELLITAHVSELSRQRALDTDLFPNSIALFYGLKHLNRVSVFC